MNSATKLAALLIALSSLGRGQSSSLPLHWRAVSCPRENEVALTLSLNGAATLSMQQSDSRITHLDFAWQRESREIVLRARADSIRFAIRADTIRGESAGVVLNYLHLKSSTVSFPECARQGLFPD